MKKIILYILITFMTISLGGCSETGSDTADDKYMKAYFLDVGQGDATLMKGSDFRVLIDAGDWQRNDVVPYLQELGVKSLDILIATHPHADHIGQFDDVIENLAVEEVWMCGNTHDTEIFEDAIDAVDASTASYNEPRKGETYEIGALEIKILNPESLTGDLHRDSLSFLAEYEEVNFLFTGDAEKEAEKAMIEGNYNIDADFFQLGHHGSSTSNTRAFLEEVSPEVGIYSAGKDNEYGHPHEEVTERLEDMDIKIYGTKENGTVKVRTDGESYDIKTER